MITNKIELTNEVIEANKNLITAICELMENNHDIKIEDMQDINIYEEGNDILTIEVEGFEYITSDNYEALESLATEYNIDIIEECGLPQSLIGEAYINGWIDESWFRDFWQESNEHLVYGESIQYIATEEELEALEDGLTTEEEIRENYLESLNNSIEGQWVDEYKFQFGDEYFHSTLLDNNLIDIESLAKWCVDMDGVAHTLATYDGQEEEFNGFYFFRTN